MRTTCNGTNGQLSLVYEDMCAGNVLNGFLALHTCEYIAS